jgi:hypothetical protein
MGKKTSNTVSGVTVNARDAAIITVIQALSNNSGVDSFTDRCFKI